MPNTTHHSDSADATETLAAGLAASLRAGAVIALEGDLGAGKTQFVRGLVRGLGGDTRLVCSPTYVLLNIYPTPTLVVYHLDAYRLSGVDDFEQIGFPEILEQGGIVVVEWASRVEALIPKDAVRISINSIDQTRREIGIQLPTRPTD